MLTEIDKQWNEKGQVTVPIRTNDLGRTGRKLEHLTALSGLIGILALAPSGRQPCVPVFIPMENNTPNPQSRAIQCLLCLVSFIGDYTHVQTVSNTQQIPEGTVHFKECGKIAKKLSLNYPVYRERQRS